MKLNNLILNTNGSIGTVILNGEDISNKVSEVQYVHKAGDIPFVKITYPLDSAEISANVKIK